MTKDEMKVLKMAELRLNRFKSSIHYILKEDGRLTRVSVAFMQERKRRRRY